MERTQPMKGWRKVDQEAYLWERYAEAEELILKYIERQCVANKDLARLERRLKQETSTRLLDWCDHISLSYSVGDEERLKRCGFMVEKESGETVIFEHPRAQLPRIVMHDPERFRPHGVALSVDSISDFLNARGISSVIEGGHFSGYRRCCVSSERGSALWVVERRGSRSFEPLTPRPEYAACFLDAREKWRTRPRYWEDEGEALDQALIRARETVATLGVDIAATIVCEVEREYWQRRNRAGQIQKMRQDRLGMGWANHDHHTFRSSRRHFQKVVQLFEILGFECRERFYAGEEAGWGAQVMENPNAHLVLFLDCDLASDEVAIDFAHEPLPELDHLGTVGLWCALHGDSILQSGMHHLEAQFLFEDLRVDLAKQGIEMMEPFSDYPYLKQAFTTGEQWAVNPVRIESLLEKELITPEEAEHFLEEGAIGSHLENLQRREGYKGFSQKNVSYVMKQTDPRTHLTLSV